MSHSTKSTLIITIVIGAVWLLSWLFFPARQDFLATFVLGVSLIIITWFDFEHFRIPNFVSYPLIIMGLYQSFFEPESAFVQHILGALLGYAFIWVLNRFWRRYRGQDGIGMGDAKLFAAAGSWVGIAALPVVALIASCTALLMVMYKSISDEHVMELGSRIAFGPFLAIGMWASWLLKI